MNVSVSELFSLENTALFLDSKKQKTNNRGRFRNVSSIWYGTLKLLIIFALKFYVCSIETPMHLYTEMQSFGVLEKGCSKCSLSLQDTNFALKKFKIVPMIIAYALES